MLYPAKLSFRIEGQIKCTPDKVKLKEFIIWRLSVKKGKEEDGRKGAGIRKYKFSKYRIDRGMLRTNRKWRSQRTYMHDPWT